MGASSGGISDPSEDIIDPLKQQQELEEEKAKTLQLNKQAQQEILSTLISRFRGSAGQDGSGSGQTLG